MTGSPVRSDVPRSPRTRPPRKRPDRSRKGPVESQALPQHLDVGLRGSLAQHGLRRISGNQMNEGEDQRRHAQQDRDPRARSGGRETRPRRIMSARANVRPGPADEAQQVLARHAQFAGGLTAMPAGAGQRPP